MPSRLVRLFVAAALVAPLVAAVPAGAKGGGAPCDVVDFSPAFGTDRTALCAHQSVRYDQNAETYVLGPIEVYATTDAGRTWRRQAATGLPRLERNDTGEILGQVMFSPNFTTDRLVYAYVGGSGLWSSTDLGATWQWLDALLLGPGPVNHTALTSFQTRDPGKDGGSAPGGFTYAYGVGIRVAGQTAPINSLHLPPFRTQVQGGPGLTETFLVPTGWPALPAFAVTFTGGDQSRMGLYECEATLVCTKRVFDTGPDGSVQRAWLAPDYATSGVVYVAARGLAGKRYGTALYRSGDFGRTFKPWSGAQRVVGGDVVETGLAFDRSNPRRGTLRVSRWLDDRLAEDVYLTTDGGSRWTRMAYVTRDARKRRGTLPFDLRSGWGNARTGVWRAGGRAFTVAAASGRTPYAGIWCSLDDGRTWARSCAR